jgi:hypothetical protein
LKSFFTAKKEKKKTVVKLLKAMFTLPGKRMWRRASDRAVKSVLSNLTINNSKKKTTNKALS